MLIETKRGRSKNLKFQFNLTETGYVFSDVSNVWFVIKHRIGDIDTDALVLKSTADGVLYLKYR